MTIHKNWCRVCGARAEEQNLCSKVTCLAQARKVAVLKQGLSRPWVATKEMVLGHTYSKSEMTFSDARAAERLLAEVKASPFDDVSEIVNQHRDLAMLMKLPLLDFKGMHESLPLGNRASVMLTANAAYGKRSLGQALELEARQALSQTLFREGDPSIDRPLQHESCSDVSFSSR